MILADGSVWAGVGFVIDLRMLYLVVPLVVGISLGYLFRDRRKVDLGKVSLGVIVVLIFSLGFGIGSNGELLRSLPEVGLDAVVILVFALGFSVVLVWAARKLVRLE
ncbi:lysine exporter LysO family protein [Candidatus Bathyarchaeota archaeon]|jgi:hypothetical protein|nr:lysine exporter LysO family protein [Candidatus Bathyarchaeota archaeon]